MPSTLPLSVTGSSAGVAPAHRSHPVRLLPLGLSLLSPWLWCMAPSPAARAAAGSTAASGAAVGVTAIGAAAQPAATPPRSLPTQAPLPVIPAGSSGTAVPAIVAPAAGPTASPLPPISEQEFQNQLRGADLDGLDLLCRQLAEAGDETRLRLLRERLLTIHPAPQPLAVVLANAGVLLSCRMPDGALTVLDRISPARGAEQVQWLTLQWRAANAALDHRRAALALERLSAERPSSLEALLLPLQQRSDGSWASRSALELLASHLESDGLHTAAAELLLLSSRQDGPAAERLAQAVRLLKALPPDVREPLFERALEQAAAAGSWGLVGELLAAQAALPASPEAAARTSERRLRLSRRLDDAYGEWRALQDAATPDSDARLRALQRQLRSPQAPGGHAEALPSPAELPPPRAAGSAAADAAVATPPPTSPTSRDPAEPLPAGSSPLPQP